MTATDAQRLKAGLDEDERRAGAMQHFTVPEQPYYSCAGSRTEPYGDLEWGEEHCDCFLAQRKARLLRDIAAKRAILALYEEFAAEQDRQLADPACKAVGPGVRTGAEVLGQVAAALAGVYADAQEAR